MPHRGRSVPLRHARCCKRLAWTEPDDTWLAARFRAAGLVFVGKTNTPELATSVTTEPHRLRRRPTTRGTSRDRRAARAAAPRPRSRPGMVAIAHGNDMGGSIRFPAVDVRHRRPQAHARPHARSVPTSASTGARSRTSTCSLAPSATPRSCSTRSRARRRVIPTRAPPPGAPVRGRGRRAARRACASGCAPGRRDGEPSHPTCVQAVEETGRLLESLGHHVEAVDLPALDEPVDAAFGTVMMVAIARDLATLGRAHRRRRSPTTTSSPATASSRRWARA